MEGIKSSNKPSADPSGNYEPQVFGYGPEAQESARAARECTKNPGHQQFIPIDKLTIDHLPKYYHDDPDVFDFIKVAADLTVRLRINETSSDRPPGGYYGSYDSRNRVGTGFLWTAVPNDDPCQCDAHEDNHTSLRVEIVTAKHVVYDDKECAMTKVDFFYDNDTSHETMKTVTGGKMVYNKKMTDWCRLVFTSCDTDLGSRLEELRRRRISLGKLLVERYMSPSSENMVWIVSHPHGIAKHITFGEIKDVEDVATGTQFSYTVATCPGSSGAPVWQMKPNLDDCWMLLVSGRRYDQTDHQVLRPDKEVLESAKAEEECETNPGHETFIPVVKLTTQHLPERYQDDADVFDFIKAVADLTVRMRVDVTSSNRPEEGYYKPIGEGTRTGSGYIYTVCHNDDPCQCPRCEALQEEPSTSWKIDLVTAKSVVFDEVEGAAAKADLFYDNEESRANGTMKTIVGGKVWLLNDKTDWCRLKFTTCDPVLGSKLMELQRWRNALGERLVERYRSHKSHNMVWVVSHPHGLSKRVTFGDVRGQDGEDGNIEYTYSEADVCPGSNGAAIWRLGFCGPSRYFMLGATAYHCKGDGRNGWNVGFC